MTEAGAGRVAMVVMVSADDDEGESSQVRLGWEVLGAWQIWQTGFG